MTVYFAYVHKDPESDFRIGFPDFPACVGYGSSMSECMNSGQQALGVLINRMVAKGEVVPAPSTLDSAAHDTLREHGTIVEIDVAN